MLDFIKVSTKREKSGVVIYPKFIIRKSSDLMIRGGDFYAIWNDYTKLWSMDEEDALMLIDKELSIFADDYSKKFADDNVHVAYLWDADSGMIDKWHRYVQKQMRDSYTMLDETLIFADTVSKKEDYASKRLPYSLKEGDYSAFDKLMSTLYSEDERHKIEWCIGSIVSGASKTLQKFMVLYGEMGSGKSTVINIIQKLFEGYYSVFDAKALGSSNNSFALEAFKSNPLVAIQHDGDLSKIEDNTRINSLVSHEYMTVNEKFKSTYSNRFKCFLIMGTNKPVKITDAKSGLNRRLIDVSPSGNRLPFDEYQALTKQINFELGAIAFHCREVYLECPTYYDNYMPLRMLGASNDFYNFMVENYIQFKKNDGVSVTAAWDMYQVYVTEAKVQYPFSKRVLKEEMRNYFRDYHSEYEVDGKIIRGYFTGFRTEKFEADIQKPKSKPEKTWIELKEQHSMLDDILKDCPAQYANSEEIPTSKWDNVKTKLSDLDTTRLHYVKVPYYLIVIDFDLKDSDGNKKFELNLKEASKWPPTYAELSKGGEGIHLHYIYDGDVTKLSSLYSKDIEVKIFSGNSSLRRRVSKCNDISVATISSGLPMKEEKKMINFDGLKNEKQIRALIKKNLNKEIHSSTKCSVDFIKKILDEAYESGIGYDVSDMKNDIIAFAANSTNQSDICLKMVKDMKFKSEEPNIPGEDEKDSIIFFDVEVFPNLFLVNWKFEGENNPVVRMINPKPTDIEDLLRYKLIGFNCRRYDNHMLYARLMGYSEEQLFKLSTKIINSKKGENRNCFFGEAYNISYTDIYDFAAKKQSLKKWEIELGIHHQELGLPWDKPVPQELWPKVAEYCDNDVIATEALFHHLKGDFTAREILAELAGSTVNDTTNSLTTRFIFGKEKHPNLVYTDLATGERTDGTKSKACFPGYEYKDGKNLYRGTDMGYGGYVYAEPGMYFDVALLDIASMHPHSILILNAFGEYTQRFKDILDTRIHIKHKEYDEVRHMFDGKLAKYLDDEKTAKALAQALKIAINSVYGLTSANFDNPFRDIRNKNNIVALCGALFMRTLQDEVQKRGFTVAHIKTDSIKIPNATPEIIKFCMDFAESYGYTFEHEATYDRMCLVNDAVYIAKFATEEKCKQLYGYSPGENSEEGGQWTATGKQFAVPYVFKFLFSKEQIIFEDMCETFSAKSTLYLDMNENLPDVSEYEELKTYRIKYPDWTKSGVSSARKADKLLAKYNDISDEELDEMINSGHDYQFVGKVGQFCPILPGKGGGILRREQDGKYYAATGTTGFRWLESELVRSSEKQDCIDESYYRKLVDDAVDVISAYGDFERFVNDDEYSFDKLETPPWLMPCGRESCDGCENFNSNELCCEIGHDISDIAVLNKH